MRINPVVVQALMALRGLTAQALANIATVTLSEFNSWLSDTEEGDSAIAFDTQLDILKMLGIFGQAPRSDIVHYWTLHEPFFLSSQVFEPLDVVLKAFGPAQITFIASQADPFLKANGGAHFALRFDTFMAVLEVKGHPLRQLRFNPANFDTLAWVGESSGVLLAPEHWQHLQPGAMRVNGLSRYLTISAQTDAWMARQRRAISTGPIPDPDPFPFDSNPQPQHTAQPQRTPPDSTLRTRTPPASPFENSAPNQPKPPRQSPSSTGPQTPKPQDPEPPQDQYAVSPQTENHTATPSPHTDPNTDPLNTPSPSFLGEKTVIRHRHATPRPHRARPTPRANTAPR